ncbi:MULTISPECIES: GNAT family N-acetyltransferase [unclassified Dyella]|uniref:GNAT family N-acetyltransferase n=1 Tax=unclassified Dyella TaxID=2634549 RepID=UPI000C82C6AD|nr:MULTISPECIES: GNAT family N-acetyltransferase [unclassified Dyella]MDR3444084.1 GNAT family N-acetyltransferase [Dyella sp.]PMQ06346.1 tRNA(Met) cytidine acetyltransferase TmcA [Dyella sp. AD56]
MIEWRGAFENTEVNALHAECFGHPLQGNDWWSRVNQFSLGWVLARRATRLIGFVNLAWDGATHAFVLDTMVAPAFQRQGIAKGLIEEAVARSKQADCDWLHVDFEPHLQSFYRDACGFRPTNAGLISLK